MTNATPLNFALRIRYLYDLGWSTPSIAIDTGLPLLNVQMVVTANPHAPDTWANVWTKKERLDRARTKPLNDVQPRKLAS